MGGGVSSEHKKSAYATSERGQRRLKMVSLESGTLREEHPGGSMYTKAISKGQTRWVGGRQAREKRFSFGKGIRFY